MNFIQNIIYRYLIVPAENDKIIELQKSIENGKKIIEDKILIIESCRRKEKELEDKIIELGIQNTKHMENENKFLHKYNAGIRQQNEQAMNSVKRDIANTDIIESIQSMINSFNTITTLLEKRIEK